MDIGQKHVQFMMRAILAASKKHIEHLLNEHQQNIGMYRNTLELVEDMLDLIAKGKAQFVDVYLENCLRHSVALVYGINQCFVTICILHYILVYFSCSAGVHTPGFIVLCSFVFCVPCHSASCRALP